MIDRKTPKQKLGIIIDLICHGNKTEFCRRAGVANSTLTSWLSRDTMDVVRVAEAFPELSPKWLTLSEGAMLWVDEEQEIQERNAMYSRYEDEPMQVAEGESIDRTLVNHLLREKEQLRKELSILRARNIELEKLYAIEHDRLERLTHQQPTM